MNACQHCGREHPVGTARCSLTGDSMQAAGIVGARLDRYQVERLLGSGGFGAVYAARHVHTDAVVALKLLKKSLGTDQGMLERFLREARAAASVGSEHIVRVMDAGLAADGQAFLALEFLDGVDLKELTAREGPLAYQRVVLIVLQALEALDAAHARGIVHRDMKPANVFVVRRKDERGTERDFVKVLDFGISKMHGDGAGAGLTMTGVAMGTPSYMAPEQFFDASRVDARADLYSVAAMLYELLTGRLPLDAESYAHLIVKVRSEQPQPLQSLAPHVPLALADAVMRGLAKEPAQRWDSAKAFAQALREAIRLPGIGVSPALLNTPSALPPAAPPALLQQAKPVAAPPGGWVVQSPAAAPVSPTPAHVGGPTMTPPAQGSGLKWVFIILGMIFVGGGCCTCGAISMIASGDETAAASVVPPRPPPEVMEPAAPEETEPVAPTEEGAEAEAKPAVDPAPAPEADPDAVP